MQEAHFKHIGEYANQTHENGDKGHDIAWNRECGEEFVDEIQTEDVKEKPIESQFLELGMSANSKFHISA